MEEENQKEKKPSKFSGRNMWDEFQINPDECKLQTHLDTYQLEWIFSSLKKENNTDYYLKTLGEKISFENKVLYLKQRD